MSILYRCTATLKPNNSVGFCKKEYIITLQSLTGIDRRLTCQYLS